MILPEPLCRPAIAAEVDSIVRLVVVKARADGFGPDDWQAMESLHHWAVGLPHLVRLSWISALGGRTNDLSAGADAVPQPDAKRRHDDRSCSAPS